MSKGMPICTVSSIRCVIPQQKHICFSKFYLDDQSCYMSVIWLAQNNIIGDVISCWRSGAPVTHVTQIFSKSSREKLLLCPLKWHYRCLFLHSESPAECIFWFLRVMCWANFFSYTSAWSASQWVRAVSSKMKMEIVKHLSDTDIFLWAQKVCNRRFPQNCLLSDELLLIICFSIYSHIKTSDCWSERCWLSRYSNACWGVWYISEQANSLFLKPMCLMQKEIGDLSDFDEGYIVTGRGLG